MPATLIFIINKEVILFPDTCTDRNEEYVCRYGCEPHCVRRTCYRQRRCSLGCHCKFGLLRDRDGRCVPVDKCQRNITQLPPNPIKS